MREQRYSVQSRPGGQGRMFVPVPFDPDAVWAPKSVHHVAGTVNGVGVRAVIGEHDGRRGFLLGPAWVRCGVRPGAHVEVVLAPEGPQRADLAEDVAAALEASPAAGAFFDSLAQFYRNAYLRWIDATTRRPEVRAQRVAEVVGLLEAGIKQRPKP
ncbi:YdeI/OmpD-associated family protein [Actinocorallia sp. API 0066]|uniref:YdeI/OmpD-associated family protein n=1 Tax=Actinocorallia sp. API 0066 TaxID=2896846 RepID=UPI001E293098|nr:YdeI/OmpD-associated family protein [Actinocorallia sp. API 0066]MCD0451719.1 YdeI/OmpD-associated family protein [Actinocorallia sp. API 0066]